MRANATGNGQPYLGTIPRAQMVKYLDEQRGGLLRSIGYLDADTVGGDTGLWYDGEEEGPMVTPNPKSDRKPQKTPLPQPGPAPDHMIFSNRNVDISQVDAQIIERLMDMAKAYGVKRILFTSGYRSHKKQKELYEDYMEGEADANYAMKPYTSWHEYGGAVDIYCPELQALPNEAFLEFGLSRPAYVPGHPQLYETWHIQLAENDILETTFEEGDEYYDSIRQWVEEE